MGVALLARSLQTDLSAAEDSGRDPAAAREYWFDLFLIGIKHDIDTE